MKIARELTGFREYVSASGRLGGSSSKIPAGAPVERCGPPVGDRHLVVAEGHYAWVRGSDVAGSWDDGWMPVSLVRAQLHAQIYEGVEPRGLEAPSVKARFLELQAVARRGVATVEELRGGGMVTGAGAAVLRGTARARAM